MTAAAAHAVGARAWSTLSADERRAGVEALNAAVDELVTAGGDRRELDIIATASAHQLILASAGAWSMSVEVPRHATREAAATFRPTYSLEGIDAAEAWVAGRIDLMPLVDALRTLADPAGGPAQLERRRAELAERRRRDAEMRERREQEAQAREQQRAQFQAENRERLARWAALPREAQAMHVLADRMPGHAELLRALAALLTPTPHGRLPDVEMPDSYLAELAGR